MFPLCILCKKRRIAFFALSQVAFIACLLAFALSDFYDEKKLYVFEVVLKVAKK